MERIQARIATDVFTIDDKLGLPKKNWAVTDFFADTKSTVMQATRRDRVYAASERKNVSRTGAKNGSKRCA
jgi:hypothetical protein